MPSASQPRDPLLLLAIAATVVLWASAFVAIRQVGHHLPAGPMALARLSIASVSLGLLTLVTPRRGLRWRPARRDWLLMVLCGVSWFGGYNLMLGAATQRLDAGTAAMLVHLAPLLIALLAGFVLGEGFPRSLLVGAGVAFAGVALIGLSTSSGHAEALGVVLCVLVAMAYAIGVVAQKPLLGRLPALPVTWVSCTVGALMCVPYAPSLVRELGTVDASTVGWLLYLGAFPTALGFATWTYALRRTPAGRMGATTYLVPVVVILQAWAVLGETPAVLALVGGSICLAGVALSRRG